MVLLWLSLLSCVGLGLSSCPDESLAEYELHFETHWDRRDFPKHYPEWRPPASWSKLIGFSHNKTFLLYRKGKHASVPFQRFIETGNSDRLDLNTQGSSGIYDAFESVPITRGVGESRVRFVLNGNHSKVSFASKITPSPDWFVGIDSYDLCSRGRWMEYIHLQSEPMDAGTDSGLTFTSPNWQTDPQEQILEITNDYPDHSAGSFYYPELNSLPTLAEFTITKINEYSLKSKFDAADSSGVLYNTVDFAHNHDDKNEKKTKNMSTQIRKKALDKNLNQVTYSSSENDLPIEEIVYKNQLANDFFSWETNKINGNRFDKMYKSKLEEPSTNTPSTITKQPEINKLTRITSTTQPNFSILNQKNQRRVRFRPRQRLLNVKHKKKIPTGDSMAVIDNIVRKYQKEHRRQLKKRRREGRRRKKNSKKIRPPRDCRVSEWSQWSGCSKTCGIGEKKRTRKMVKKSRRGGKPCPSLKETTWCGSASACPRDYFNWSF